MKANALLMPFTGNRAPARSGAADLMAFVADGETQDRVNRVTSAFWPGARVEQGGVDAAVTVLRAEPSPPILIVDVGEEEQPVRALRKLRDLCEAGTVVIALGRVNDVAFFRSLIAEGVSDYLVKPIDADALHRAILAALRDPAQDADAPQRHARTVAVIGARGGVGATTVATTLGWILAHERKRSVSIVDLDLHFGTVGLALDLAPTGGLPDALAHAARVDSLFVASATVAESESLSILAAEEPLETDRPIDPAALDRLLGELSRNVDCIVLDVPRFVAVAEPAVLSVANDVVIVSDLSMAGLRDTLRFVERASVAVPGAALSVVINRDGSGGKGQLTQAEFEKALGRDVLVCIPEDGSAIQAAVNAGKPLPVAAEKSKLVAALRQFSRKLVPEPEAPKPSFLGRLFG